jgi:S1-C subfamily serine protease
MGIRLPRRLAAGLVLLLWTACGAIPLHASGLNPVAVAIVESSGGSYFEPTGRRIVLRNQPSRLSIRIRNTSEAAVMIRARPEKVYSIELKDQAGVTFLVKRKKESGGEQENSVRVNLSPGADKVIPMEISGDIWEGGPDLEPGKENQFIARVVYENADGQTVYSEPYTLIFNSSDSPTLFPKRIPAVQNTSREVVAEPVEPVGSGTGWFCQGGYVVTCFHVVKGHKTFTVASGRLPKRKASVVAKDEMNDLAVLKLDDSSGLPAGIPISQQSPVLGEKVFTIGYPLIDLFGQSPKLSEGVVSSIQGMRDDPRTLQMTVSIQGGNSGGPLLNMTGQVIGVVQSKLSAVMVFGWTGDLAANVNYAVKSTYVQTLIGTLPIDSAARLLPAQAAEMVDVVKRVQDSVVVILSE